jgi:dihydroflavonol-4-reductase
MKLLITGATGFIGSQLALQAQAAGHEVVLSGLITNSAERDRCERLARAGLRVIDGSLRIPSFVERVVKGCDAVIHLAAAQCAPMADDYYFDTNVEATRMLLESCVRNGVRRFVLGSTVDVYASARERAICEESSVVAERIEISSKLAAEELVRLFGERLQITIARIGEAYGPEDFQLLKLLRLIERGVVPEVGSCRNFHQPIHVHDVVRGLLRMLEHPAATGETFILAGPSPITTRSIIDACALAMGARVHYVRVPFVSFSAAASLSYVFHKRLGLASALDWRALDFFGKSLWFATEKLQKRLQFQPTINFEAGVRDTVNWYRQKGYLPPREDVVRPLRRVRSMSEIPLDAMSDFEWQLSEVFESTRDAIIVWDLHGHEILYWNAAAEDLYGFTRAEAQGRMTHSLLNTRIEGGVSELESKLDRFGGWAGTLIHRKKDHTEIAIDAQLTMLSHQDGRPLVLEVNRPVPIASKVATARVESTVLKHEAVRIGVSTPGVSTADVSAPAA